MTRHMGYYGQQILLQDDERLPLIGQIATVSFQIIPNNALFLKSSG